MEQNRETETYPHEYSQLTGNSLVVQWLGLGAFTARAWDLIPGWGTKVPPAVCYG